MISSIFIHCMFSSKWDDKQPHPTYFSNFFIVRIDTEDKTNGKKEEIDLKI